MTDRSTAQRRAWRDPAIRKRRVQGLRRKWRTDVVYAMRVRSKFMRWLDSPEGKAHRSRNGRKTILLGRGGRLSRPEVAMTEMLRARGIPFRTHVRFGVWVADFVLPGKIVLEVDSERFHRETRARDARKDADLRERGFRVVRLDASKVMRMARRRTRRDSHNKGLAS